MIYRTIKAICKKRGISVSAVEKEAGLGSGTICKWSESSPTIGSLQAVAKVLECTVDELLSEDTPEAAGEAV